VLKAEGTAAYPSTMGMVERSEKGNTVSMEFLKRAA